MNIQKAGVFNVELEAVFPDYERRNSVMFNIAELDSSDVRHAPAARRSVERRGVV